MPNNPAIRLQLFAQTCETQPSLFPTSPLPKESAPACPHPLLSWQRQPSLFPNTADGFTCRACGDSLRTFAPVLMPDGTHSTMHLSCALDRCDSVRILHDSTTATTCAACAQN